MRRPSRSSIQSANAPRSARYGRKRSTIAHGMVRRRQRWPILLPKAVALARSRGSCCRLPACSKSIGIKPTKPWSIIGEKQHRASATGLLPCPCPAQVCRRRQADWLSEACQSSPGSPKSITSRRLARGNADTRLIVRRREGTLIIRELKAKLTELSEEVCSKSVLSKAVSYTLNHWAD